MKIDIQQHDLVPKHEVISESEKELLQQNSDFDINNLPKIKINDPVVKEFPKDSVSVGDVIKITRNSKTAGEFISYRIVIEG
ncbi:DNA-directed RNA polymerase subunit H [uncultured Methanobrevibacter sp.]|uniref:DNA-directed RNA polymerase subunit H n=1 Tax=Methanobrevibacter sp. TaxID=66852 RepID=UPI0025FBE0AF|nr:DNA-directed RNA polymerase subunit H [uncultured Methanobrevibacter sp.]